jgi:hypothetical protein
VPEREPLCALLGDAARLRGKISGLDSERRQFGLAVVLE